MTIDSVTHSATDLPDLTGLAPLHPTLPHAVIFTQPVCPTCTQTMTRLAKSGLPAVAIDMTQQPQVMAQFAERLAVSKTPIVLVHNTFDRPVYFWSTVGVALDQIRYATKAVKERLAHLEAAGAFESGYSADSYLAALAEAASTAKPAPRLTLEQYVDLAGEHLAPIRLQSPRIELAAHHELVTAGDKVPPVLMD